MSRTWIAVGAVVLLVVLLALLSGPLLTAILGAPHALSTAVP